MHYCVTTKDLYEIKLQMQQPIKTYAAKTTLKMSQSFAIEERIHLTLIFFTEKHKLNNRRNLSINASNVLSISS